MVATANTELVGFTSLAGNAAARLQLPTTDTFTYRNILSTLDDGGILITRDSVERLVFDLKGWETMEGTDHFLGNRRSYHLNVVLRFLGYL